MEDIIQHLPPVVCRRALTYVISVCFGIVVSNTFCVVFLFCLSSFCVPYIAIFSGLSICDCPFRVLQCLFNTKGWFIVPSPCRVKGTRSCFEWFRKIQWNKR